MSQRIPGLWSVVGEDFHVAMQGRHESIPDGILDHMANVMGQQGFVVFTDAMFFALAQRGDGRVLAKPSGHGFDRAGEAALGAGGSGGFSAVLLDEVPEDLRTADVFPADPAKNGMQGGPGELVNGVAVGFDGGEFAAQEGIEDSVGVFGGFHNIKKAEPDCTLLQGKCQAADSGEMP